MAKQKHLERTEQLFKKSPVVFFSDINRIVKDKKNTAYAKQLLNSLVKKRRVKRITKGCYTLFDDVGLSVLCFKPSYLGLQSALSFHGLWEQETIPVVITANPVRQGIRKCMGMNVLIRKSNKKYIFGYEFVDDAGYYLPYSDIEKSFIDFFVFREKLSPELIETFKKKIDVKRLKRYLSVYPKRINIKVINALAKRDKKHTPAKSKV
ncbi:hypothetical protein HYW21_02090 [Candidatus Woesearchaeota archaeon]|nr:hypothetical protein [Candidatus Woesearchaeota archaeon]